AAVMDPTTGFAYFGTATAPGIVVKVNIRLDNLVLSQVANVTARAGDVLTYTLSVLNDSAETATGLTLTDTLPVSVTFVSVTPGPATCNPSGIQVYCNLGSLTAGANTTVTVQAVDDASITRGTLVNSDSESAKWPRRSP